MDNVQSNQLRILIVDDEKPTLRLYQRILSSKKKEPKISSEPGELASEFFGKSTTSAPAPSFDLVTCRQGDEAVDAVKKSLKENRPFAVAFLDILMPPGPDGIWTAKHIRALDPNIEIVMVTAHSDVNPGDIASQVPPPHKLLYLQKPFRPQEITQFASALGSKWRTERELWEVYEDLETRIEKRTLELMDANEQLEEEIEERKQVEKHLRQLIQSEQRYRIVLEAAPDPVAVYDIEEKITYLNPAFTRVFGWPLEESSGQTIDFVPVESLHENRLLFEKIAAGEIVSGIVTSRLTRNRNRVDVSISGAGFFDKHGKRQGSVLTFQDITARKQTEEEMKGKALERITDERDSL